MDTATVTVRDYWERYSQPGDETIPIAGWDGWEIEAHDDGLCLLSPGTSARELRYRDDSTCALAELLHIAD